jgi:hypothetical protein
MEPGTWIAIFLPLFLLLIMTLPAGLRRRTPAAVRRKGRRPSMTNELLKTYMGSRCVISTGAFGSSVTGVISAVEENWIEVTTRKGTHLLNADYVTNIVQLPKK